MVTCKWQPHLGRSVAVNGKNRQLVTDGPVEVQYFRKIIHHFERNLENIPQTSKVKPKDVNM